MKTKTIVLFLFGIISIQVQAQNHFSAHVHIAPPVGNFKMASDFFGSIDHADPLGYAGIGIGVGFEYRHPLGDKGLQGFLALDCFRNPIRRAWKKAYNLTLEDDETIKYSSYYNIPITLGIHYPKEIKENLSLFLQLGGVFDILKVSHSKKIDISGVGTHTKKETFAPSISFGSHFRAGMIINERYIVGIGYKSLGIHSIEKTYLYIDPFVEETTMSFVQKGIAIMNITLGINF
jgi:hypothetical protein